MTFTADELAAEAGLPVDRIHWLVRLGVLRPREPGPFRFGDVFRVKLVAALMNSEAVVEAVENPELRFDRAEAAALQGVPEQVVLFRVRARDGL